MPPIYLTTTYVQSTPVAYKGFKYSRMYNPIRAALERSFASFEKGNLAWLLGVDRLQ